MRMNKVLGLSALMMGSALAGCATTVDTGPRPGVATMEQALSNPDVLAAVNSCVDSPFGRMAYVTDVAPTAAGNVRVTTVNARGERANCTVDTTTKQVLSVDAVARDSGQVFFPLKVMPKEPKGSCFVAQQVNQNGVPQGWLLRKDPTQRCAGEDWLAQFRSVRG